jgi:hypothetical protein
MPNLSSSVLIMGPKRKEESVGRRRVQIEERGSDPKADGRGIPS